MYLRMMIQRYTIFCLLSTFFTIIIRLNNNRGLLAPDYNGFREAAIIKIYAGHLSCKKYINLLISKAIWKIRNFFVLYTEKKIINLS